MSPLTYFLGNIASNFDEVLAFAVIHDTALQIEALLPSPNKVTGGLSENS